MSGADLPLLTITDFDDLSTSVENRKAIIISARVHPGESNGSWMMHGLLYYLISDEAALARK